MWDSRRSPGQASLQCPESTVTPFWYVSTIALNIKDPETEQLAREVAQITGESKTGAIRTALRERKERLELERSGGRRGERLRKWLEEEVWPSLPPDQRGRAPTKEEREEILGYGPEGY